MHLLEMTFHAAKFKRYTPKANLKFATLVVTGLQRSYTQMHELYVCTNSDVPAKIHTPVYRNVDVSPP